MTPDQQALKSALDTFEAAVRTGDADAIASAREDVEMAALFGKSTVFAEQGVDLLSAIMKIASKQVPEAAIKEYALATLVEFDGLRGLVPVMSALIEIAFSKNAELPPSDCIEVAALAYEEHKTIYAAIKASPEWANLDAAHAEKISHLAEIAKQVGTMPATTH
jgi:hypothetical protein